MADAIDLVGVAGVVGFVNAPLTEPMTTIDPSAVTKGSGVWEKTRVLYADKTGELTVGVWESSSGAWNVLTTEDEYVRVLEGQIRLTDKAGETKTFGVGDSFFVPENFDGEWENIGTVRKIFMSLKRKRS